MGLLVGLPVCPSGVSGGPSPLLAEVCWVLWGFLCCVRLCCGLMLVEAVVVCVVCARVCVLCVVVMRLGACPRLSGLGLAALCRCGGCAS